MQCKTNTTTTTKRHDDDETTRRRQGGRNEGGQGKTKPLSWQDVGRQSLENQMGMNAQTPKAQKLSNTLSKYLC